MNNIHTIATGSTPQILAKHFGRALQVPNKFFSPLFLQRIFSMKKTLTLSKSLAPIFKSGMIMLKSFFDFSQRKTNAYVAEAKRSVGFSFPRTEVPGNKVRGNNSRKIVGHFESVLQLTNNLFSPLFSQRTFIMKKTLTLSTIIATIFKSGIKIKSLFDFSQWRGNVYVAEAKRSVGFSFPRTEVPG
ncbi:MAG: hypothetical protein AAB071_05405, partial [Bacteroidota bacterium]